MGFIIIILALVYAFYVFSNEDLKLEKIKSYLGRENPEYVNHRKVVKPYNANFEIGENLLTWLYFRKHHYEIDALNLIGDPVVVSAIHYQSMLFFFKNRTYFTISEI
ncbi:hypothetical protein NYZ99_06790 [Maribacter litopenaei]|uniref:Uncharacterized protein n=1 Tax=Maribacter litopenaei TaxID=2976127 RepID=A0ABY5YAF4_9FLAO|nr:hypothetical protein [Maribacter litopenaei]UWX56022.1 hypothetical protein NYZ99_06790 [Maribacter litopenaei]